MDGNNESIRKKNRSSVPSLFLTNEEKRAVVEAIKEAEKNTSGEIRVHLEMETHGDVAGGAKNVFEKLGMHNTAAKNGVLIFLSIKNKKFAILGDSGINERVSKDFWKDASSVMEGEFRKNRFAEGLAEGIKMAGEKLKAYFPYQKDDVNELPDDISY